MEHLESVPGLAMTRYVDFALGLVEDTRGVERIEYYLFYGTQV